MDILKDIPWLITTNGEKTVYEVLTDPTAALDKNVSGFVYGAQFRFLMTLIPLIELYDPESKNRGYFTGESLTEAFKEIQTRTNLFDDTYPFLQITEQDTNGAKISDPTNEPTKMFPDSQGANDNQSVFWDFNKPAKILEVQQTVLGLACFYFYGVGTNTKLLTDATGGADGKGLKLSNGSSALAYKESFEIISEGENLVQSLYMNTPKSFLGDNRIPHWADREAVGREYDYLWKFSWSANSVFTKWNDERTELVNITRGGIPKKWRGNIPTTTDDLWGKEYHSQRQTEDPLYLYTVKEVKGKEELILKRLNWSSEPYYSVSRWHSEKLSEELQSKLSMNILNGHSNLNNLTILEHATEGTANSFSIRHSKVIDGFQDSLFIDSSRVQELFNNSNSVINMRKKVLGFFSPKGTCKHLMQARDIMENEFWNEVHYLTMRNLTTPMSRGAFNKELKERTIKAFEKVSSRRNTVHIKSHFQALQILQNIKL